MPVYTVEIPTPGTTMNRQFIHNVVDNLMRNLGVEGQDILFLGAAYDNSSQPNSTVGEERDVSFGNTSRIFVEVDERRIHEGAGTRAVGYDLEAPLFQNKCYGVTFSPNYVPYELNITIKRRAPARSMLGGWTNMVQRKIDMGMDCFVTEGNFSYRIPIPSLNLLKEIHDCINYNIPEENQESLKTFLKNGFHTGVTVASNLAGKGLTFMARTAACRVVGQIDQNSISRTKEGEGGAWMSQMNYTLTYHRPESIVMSYPCIFNNTLIDPQYWYETNAPGVSSETYASRGVAVATQDKMVALPDTIALPIFVPECDRKRPILVRRHRGEVDIFVGYLTFDKDCTGDIHHAFNIKDLGEIGFMYNELTYLRLIGREDPHMLSSMIHVNIFKNGYVFDKEYVAIDGNLDVWIKGTVDIGATYQFSISMDTSFENLDDTGKDLVSKVPGLVGDIVVEFHPELIPDYPGIDSIIPMPPDPNSPDLPEYPFDIPDPIPPGELDPESGYEPDPNDPDKDVVYPPYPGKPVYPGDPTQPLPPDVVDDLEDDTITDPTDPRDPNRDDVCSIFQLNVFNGKIVARRKIEPEE